MSLASCHKRVMYDIDILDRHRLIFEEYIIRSKRVQEIGVSGLKALI